MEILYAADWLTAAEVRERMAEPPSYSAVRALMRILEEKGHLSHEQDGPRYVYLPTVPRDAAQASALSHLVRTFFGGSAEAAVAALLDLPEHGMSEGELDRLSRLIDDARGQGR